MSKCLRCGAGNEWIEPVAKEAKKPRRKRPKVRYVVIDYPALLVVPKGKQEPGDAICDPFFECNAKRIAAALNLYEAVRRGEM